MNKLKLILKSNFAMCILGLGLYLVMIFIIDLISFVGVVETIATIEANGFSAGGTIATSIIFAFLSFGVPLTLVFISAIVYKKYLIFTDKDRKRKKHKFAAIVVLLSISELVATFFSSLFTYSGIYNLNDYFKHPSHYYLSPDSPNIFTRYLVIGIVLLVFIVFSLVHFVLFVFKEKKRLYSKVPKAKKEKVHLSETEMLLSNTELKESLIKGKTMSSEDTIKEEDLAYRVEYTIEAKNDIEILRKKGLLNSFNSILDKMKNETFLNPKKSNVLDNELTGLFTQKINHQYKFAYMVFEDERIIRIVRILPTKK